MSIDGTWLYRNLGKARKKPCSLYESCFQRYEDILPAAAWVDFADFGRCAGISRNNCKYCRPADCGCVEADLSRNDPSQYRQAGQSSDKINSFRATVTLWTQPARLPARMMTPVARP